MTEQTARRDRRFRLTIKARMIAMAATAAAAEQGSATQEITRNTQQAAAGSKSDRDFLVWFYCNAF